MAHREGFLFYRSFYEAIHSLPKRDRLLAYEAVLEYALFERLQAIVDGNLVLDDLKTDVVEVKLWEAETAGAFPAVKEEAYIEITSYGGDTTGYQIPFTLHYTGVKTKGAFNPATKAFTVGSAPAPANISLEK